MAATSPSRLFVDSSAFIALICRDDSAHSRALSYYKSLNAATRLCTTILVVSETYAWLRYHVGFSVAARFLRSVEEMEPGRSIELLYVSPELKAKTHQTLLKYPDQMLSYVDALSFVVVEEEDIGDVFSLDRHFHILKRRVWPTGARE
jgi:hypothetical protein